MYINFLLLAEKNLKIELIPILQIISQNRNENLAEIIEKYVNIDDLRQLNEDGYTEYVKSKNKSETAYNTVRISNKGKKLLEDLQTYKVLEDDCIVFSWLKKLFLSLDKEIGSEIKCKNLIAWFRSESGISKNELITLCKAYVNDSDRMEYSKVLQFMFWKGENHFQTTPKLEDSKLWNYYEKHREYFDAEFLKIRKD